jgi:uncharacterized phage-associated protein
MAGLFDTSSEARSLQLGLGGMALELSFEFRLEKVLNALAYFSEAGVGDLTKLKAVKLLYLADQYHFLRYGRPISGDRYIAMDLGPVPESTYQLTNRLVDPDEVDDRARQIAETLLVVDKGFLGRSKYPVLRARKGADTSVFSDSELEALKATVREHGTKSARALVNLTHDHRAYKRANAHRLEGSSVPLPYEFFLEDAPQEQAAVVRELAGSEQEDRNFAESLRVKAKAARGAQNKATPVAG